MRPACGGHAGKREAEPFFSEFDASRSLPAEGGMHSVNSVQQKDFAVPASRQSTAEVLTTLQGALDPQRCSDKAIDAVSW